MAIGTLAPSTWYNGTVDAVSFMQGVTDNINGLLAGTGPSLKGILLDETGSSSTTAEGNHLGFHGATPGVAFSTGAGTGPTGGLAAGSNDSCGTISFTSGTGPSSSATILTMTLSVAFANGASQSAISLISPANTAAAALSPQPTFVVVGNTGTLHAGSVALTATTAYQWNYIVIGQR